MEKFCNSWIDVTYFSKFKLYHLNVSPQLPAIEHLYVLIQDIVLKSSVYIKDTRHIIERTEFKRKNMNHYNLCYVLPSHRMDNYIKNVEAVEGVVDIKCSVQ